MGKENIQGLHRGGGGARHGPGTPSPWIMAHAGRIESRRPGGDETPARVLDLACGRGRHSRALLALGHAVTAVDIDCAGLADIAGHPGLEVLQADLEKSPAAWPLEGRRFAAVVITNYLWRALFPFIAGAVAPGGILLYETFAVGNEHLGRPASPDFLLREGELSGFFAESFEVIDYFHGPLARPRPAVIQRLCARKRA